MVQANYFGDSRDYFKYDLITYLLKDSNIDNYGFIPMLTEPRNNKEGDKKPQHIRGKSPELLSYINNCNSKNLEHWKTWLLPRVSSYKTVNPVNNTYFKDNQRCDYWKKFQKITEQDNALIYVDPDIGLEIGNPSYLEKQGREKYLMDNELSDLFKRLAENSILMVYQHLQRNKHKHDNDAENRIKQAYKANKNSYVSLYREGDLAFIFLTKLDETHQELMCLLNKYHKNSEHKYKSKPIFSCS